MADKLKPCPFCGEQAITLDRRNGTWIVACLRIECPAKIVGPSKQAVMTAWNRRAEVSEGPTTAGPMPEILGMRVVEDAQVPLGEARIVAPDGTCVATLDLIYGGYTIHRAAGMKGGN